MTPSKPAIIIRRHAPVKPHPRARLPDDLNDEPGPSNVKMTAQSSTLPDASDPGPSLSANEPVDELVRVRQLLRPPPISGVEDWGILPEPSESCDEAIKVRSI